MRVAIATLGCKVNQYDSAVMSNRFSDRGWQSVAFSEPADAYVVNSCTVTARADSDARRLCRKARRTSPAARVIMTGCYAQVSAPDVAALEEVDYVVGLGRLDDLLDAVNGELEERIAVSDLRKTTEVTTLGLESFPGRDRAFVKVQEGCNLFCTFCVIPIARGRSRSVSPRLIIEEIERLAARGYHEVVLTGVHLGGWGADLEPAETFAFLLEAIAERKLPLRVRISSLDPPELSERLLDVIAEPGFCRHLHVPLQACDNSVLERMRRRYTLEQADKWLERLATRVPGVTIGTDLITGFPSESRQQFESGLGYLENSPVNYLHVFPYSRRDSTSASSRWKEVETSEVHRRATEARELDSRLRDTWLSAHVSAAPPKRLSMLVESERDKTTGLLRGYSDEYLPLLLDGKDSAKGRLVAVNIDSRQGERLRVVAT
jgi:threonylcarbamoyladenosine tRNA methylthiotransferase MtaB